MSTTVEDCIFCDIILGKAKAWKLFESDTCIAFLTPFPNTPGFTVIATKAHLDSYVFNLDDDAFRDLMEFSKIVALKLDKALNCTRTGLIIEGMGVNHAHAKLIPMHGVGAKWKQVKSEVNTFSPAYLGYLSSNDGPRLADEELDQIREIILSQKPKSELC